MDLKGLLAEALDRFGRPSRIVADRWREAELRDALDAAGVPPAALEIRGQGFKDGAEDVRGFRRAVLERRVRRAQARDDAAAAILAAAAGTRQGAKPPVRRRRHALAG